MQISMDTIRHFFAGTSEYFITLFAAFISYFIVKKVLFAVVRKIFSRTKNTLDDHLIDSKIFGQLALIAPALVILYSRELLHLPVEVVQIVSAFITFNVTLFLIRLFTVVNSIYNTFPISSRRPIKGYIQLVQVIAGFMGVVASVYIAVGKSPLGFISGLGAMTAVLLLIFRDTILSFIAGMQIMFNDLIHKGDWIEVPNFGADGDVIDIALYTVTVQNFDKTIVSIPTSKLLEGSFRNWRGMTEAGGRRIKRSLLIDQSSIRFLKKTDIDKLKKINLITDYLENKEKEGLDTEGTDLNKRKLTNIGTFRAYIREYLKNNPSLRSDMTLIVRQLPPGPDGLPLEIYVFAGTTDWVEYEGIQSDIFDNLLAAVKDFDLRVFQHPSGADMQRLTAL